MARIPVSGKKRKVYLSLLSIDLRIGVKGLQALVEKSEVNVKKDDVFVFLNKRRTIIKLLVRHKEEYGLIINHQKNRSRKHVVDFLFLY